jgi:hypothetical protein
VGKAAIELHPVPGKKAIEAESDRPHQKGCSPSPKALMAGRARFCRRLRFLIPLIDERIAK